MLLFVINVQNFGPVEALRVRYCKFVQTSGCLVIH